MFHVCREFAQDTQNVQQDVLMKISKIISECGAEIASPTRTIQVSVEKRCQLVH